MSYIRNNQEYFMLALVVVGMFAMASGLGVAFRGGNPSAITSVRSVVALVFHAR